MAKDTKKTPLSDEQLAECQKLKAIYARKKKGLGLSQEKIGDELGINQSAVAHYLNGLNQLNLAIAIKFAAILQVKIDEFSPSLAKQLSINDITNNYSPSKPQTILIQSFDQIISNSDIGIESMGFVGEISQTSKFYKVETDLMEGRQGVFIPRGSILRIEPVQPSVGDIALYNVGSSPILGELSIIAGESYVRPSNAQYQAIPVDKSALVGVVFDIIQHIKR